MKKRITVYISIFLVLLLLPHSVVSQKKSNSANDLMLASTQELRVNMDAFFARFSGLVEEAADSIKSSTDDKKIKAKALFWKMNAIPAAQRSIFSTNPFEACIDANVLCIQMDHFFKDGKGKSVFGDYQYIAIEASARLRKEINTLGDNFIKEKWYQNSQDEIQFFALNNPIQSLYFNRNSSKPVLASILGSENDRIKKVALDMNQSVKDLNNRINFFTDLMPKQIRWQSEYMMYELMPDNVKKLETLALDTLLWQMDSLTAVATKLPFLINNQRKLAFDDIEKEREILVKLIQEERALAFKLMQDEREVVLNELNEQRKTVFQESDELVEKSLNSAFFSTKQMLDYFILRVVFILTGIFIAIALLIILNRRLK